MSQSTDLISIIIVNFNTAQDTIECLESLQNIKAEDFRYNVVVVDNGSHEPLDIPQKLLDSNVELLRTEANIGFTGGNNLGISHAVKEYNPDYFLLLNSDTTVDPQFLTEMYLDLKNDPQAGITSSKIYFYPGNEFHHQSYDKTQQVQIIWYGGGSIDWLNLQAFHRGVDELDRGQFDQQKTSEFATGCSLLIKREVTEKVGILDKKYFLYLEDVDFSIRVKRYGYKILFSPTSIVYHKNAGSTQGAGSQIHQYYQSRNRLFFFMNYGSLRQKVTVISLIFRWILTGTQIQKKAVLDYLLGKMEKQPVV